MFRGEEFAVFDHELTLCQNQILFWREPWVPGGFDGIADRKTHIFAKPRIAACPPDLNRFVAAWQGLSDTRVDEYINALPPEWRLDEPFLAGVRDYLVQTKGNIVAIVENALRALR